MNLLKILGFSFLVLLVFSGCFLASRDAGARKNPAQTQEPGNPEGTVVSRPLIALSIPPQEYFARRIGGDRVETLVLAGPGQDPHNYEPNPRQLQDLAGAGAWLLSGTEFETGLEPKIRALFPDLKVIDGTEGIRFRSLGASHHHDEDTDQDDEHDEDGIDRHTWLGYQGAETMSRHIRDALCAMDESNASFYRENYEVFIGEAREEFEKLKGELEILKGKTVLVYHPAFGYFLDDFGIIQEAVETGGKEPTPRILTRLIEKARAEKVRAVFVQAQFPAQSARTVAQAVGAELIVLDPLAPDWLANIRKMGDGLKRAAAWE